MPVPVLAARWDPIERDPRLYASIGRVQALWHFMHGWSVAGDKYGRPWAARFDQLQD